MKQKTLVISFILISLLLTLSLPLYNFLVNGQQNDYKKYWNTDIIEKYLNYSVYKFFNYSLNQKQVIAGKDGFLFLGNDYADTLHKTNGTYKLSVQEIEEYTNALKNLQKWYEDRGIKFVIAIAPNKSSIYKEKLPNSMKYDGKTFTDDIVEAANLKNINLVDLRPNLIKAKKQNLLYYKTDTHWNSLGASIAYESIISYIDKQYKIDINKPIYSVLGPIERDGGDLKNFLKTYENIRDIDFMYNFPNQYDICLGKIDINNNLFQPCEIVKNPIVSINQNVYYTTNNNATSQYKLLFLCDSFAMAPSMLYNATFQSIYKAHYGHLYGQQLVDLVYNHRPDIVIYQIVERHFPVNNIFLPDISYFNQSVMNDNRYIIFDISKDKYMKYNDCDIVKQNEVMNMIASNDDPIIEINETKSKSNNVILSCEIDTSINTTFQIFYKKEDNLHYNEKDSFKVPLQVGHNKFNLLIPSKYLNNILRLDLVSNTGTFTIKKLIIYDE